MLPQWAEDIRKQNETPETRLGHFPRWMKSAIRDYMQRERIRKNHSDYQLLMYPIFGIILDHWGTCDKGKVFVNEPYTDRQLQHKNLADVLKIELTIIPQEKSYWYPTQTFRYEFREFS